MVGTAEQSIITNQTIRVLEERGIENLRINKNFAIPEFDNDDDPPQGTYYRNTAESVIKKKTGPDPTDVIDITSAGSPVDSVFGREGAVTAQGGDYTWSQVGDGYADPFTTSASQL